MEKDGGIYVSENTRIENFRRLDLNKRQGRRPDIERAINIFRDRIEQRYLDQIQLLNRNTFTNGFVSMALCCLLIDTFYQFEHGVKKTTQNHVNYVDFLRNHLDDVFDTYEKANRFYTDIRCGILHSAQTKNGSQLSAEQDEIIIHLSDAPNASIRVDVSKLGVRLNEYFNEYCNRVCYDEATQSNFVKKMKNMFKPD